MNATTTTSPQVYAVPAAIARPAGETANDTLPDWLRTVERAERHLREIAPAQWPAVLHLAHQQLWRALNRGAATEDVRRLLAVVDKIAARLRVKFSELVEAHANTERNRETRR